MSKLAIISDFHMDSNHFSEEELLVFEEVLREEQVTDLHFAGDISNDLYGISFSYLNRLSRSFIVTYNLGNHDMIGLTENEIDKKDFLIKKLGNKTLLAFHGWYDYSFYGGDLDKIGHFKDNFYFDRKIHRDFDDQMTTEILLEKLNQVLNSLEGEVIVALHFVPHAHFIIDTRYEKFERFNAFLGSKTFHETFLKYPNITDVVFGHIHQRYNPTVIDKINYHARPLGYTYEWEILRKFLIKYPKFQDDTIRQPKKKYNHIKELVEWKEYKKNHLKDEFRSAMTTFDF